MTTIELSPVLSLKWKDSSKHPNLFSIPTNGFISLIQSSRIFEESNEVLKPWNISSVLELLSAHQNHHFSITSVASSTTCWTMHRSYLVIYMCPHLLETESTSSTFQTWLQTQRHWWNSIIWKTENITQETSPRLKTNHSHLSPVRKTTPSENPLISIIISSPYYQREILLCYSPYR